MDYLRERGVIAEVKKMDDITIVKYSGVINYKYIKEDK